MFTERRFNTGNVELNFAEGPPNGNALVMLHGISNWRRHFLPIMQALYFRHHIHALDFRGCGHSGVISWGRPKFSTRSIICLAKVNIPEIPSMIAFGPDPYVGYDPETLTAGPFQIFWNPSIRNEDGNRMESWNITI